MHSTIVDFIDLREHPHKTECCIGLLLTRGEALPSFFLSIYRYSILVVREFRFLDIVFTY